MQQRGIPSWYMRLLIEQGKTTHDGHDAMLKTVSNSARLRFRKVLSRQEYGMAERYFGVYAVVSSGHAVVTAARQTHRRFR